jgi:hypothetical protein
MELARELRRNRNSQRVVRHSNRAMLLSNNMPKKPFNHTVRSSPIDVQTMADWSGTSVALGASKQEISIAGGFTSINFSSGAGPVGVFAQPANEGTYGSTRFAFVPEVRAKLAMTSPQRSRSQQVTTSSTTATLSGQGTKSIASCPRGKHLSRPRLLPASPAQLDFIMT